MKPCRARALIPIITAYAAHQAIQYQAPSGEWIDPVNDQDVDFGIRTQYRVKPPLPTPPPELYINVYEDTNGVRFGQTYVAIGEEDTANRAIKAEQLGAISVRYVLGTEHEALRTKYEALLFLELFNDNP